MTHQVISANRLNDGLVVYLTEAGDWAEKIDAALIVDGQDAASAAIATANEAVAQQTIVDPYAIDIEQTDDRRQPTKLREFIRAHGPTVRRDLGKQAVNG